MKFFNSYLNKMRGGKQVPARAPMHEMFWSALGGFAGIYSIYFIGHFHMLHLQDSLFLVGSLVIAVLIYNLSPYRRYPQF